MFARIVESPVKAGTKEAMRPVLMNELLPLIKKQEGIVDFIALTTDTSPDAVTTLSLWETKEQSERFWTSKEFKSVMERLTPMMEHMTVRTFNVEASILHKIITEKAA